MVNSLGYDCLSHSIDCIRSWLHRINSDCSHQKARERELGQLYGIWWNRNIQNAACVDTSDLSTQSPQKDPKTRGPHYRISTPSRKQQLDYSQNMVYVLPINQQICFVTSCWNQKDQLIKWSNQYRTAASTALIFRQTILRKQDNN